MNNKNKLGKILRQRRLMIPLTITQLSTIIGISIAHLSRIERGVRFPSARVLQKIADPLKFSNNELFTLAGCLSARSSAKVVKIEGELRGPYVASKLSKKLIEIQYAIIAILITIKRIAMEYQFNVDFTE